MAEMNDKKDTSIKNKSSTIWLVIRWIGKVILIILLMLLIIFQFPWKVIALFTITLAACTILPRRYRKWFWLTAGIVVLILVIWIFLPEDNTGWRPYSFDEELADLEIKYALPDDENAALIYDSILKDYDYKKMHPAFLKRDLDRLTYSELWMSRDYPELAQWIQEQEHLIQSLFKAVQKDKCHFPINVQLMVTDKLEINRLSALRSWGLLLLRAANNDMAEGRTEQAIEKYLSVIRMMNHINQQQQDTYLLMSYIPEQQTLIALNRFLIEGEPTTKQLLLISDSISSNLQNNWCLDFSRWLETNVLFWKNAFGLFYEINSDGQIRFSRNPTSLSSELFFSRRLGRFFRDKQAHKIYAVLAWFFLPSTSQKAADTIETIHKQYQPMSRRDFDWTKKPTVPEISFKFNYDYMVKSVIVKENDTDRLYRHYYDMYIEQITLRRGLRLLVGIKQYRLEYDKWPDSLEEIKSDAPAEAFIDPATGKQLQYENHGRYFSLYGETINIWPR